MEAIEASADAAARGEVEPGVLRESLKRAAWSRASATKVRLAAIAALIEDEPNLDDTRSMLRLMLPTEPDFGVIERISTLAGERGWEDLTPSLVRSWSRGVEKKPDAERPERRALEMLHPGAPVEDAVFRVFAGAYPEHAMKERERTAAWGLLQRLDADGSRTRELLATNSALGEGDSEADRTLAVLRRAAADFGCVPRTGEQLEWLLRLSRDEHQGFWESARQIVDVLDAEQRAGMELRHLPGLIWAREHRPEWLNAPREALLSTLEAGLEGSRKHERAGGDQTTAGRSLLRAARDRLGWGDVLLANIGVLVRQNAGAAGLLFTQAEQDRSDTSTEYGGVIRAEGAGFRAIGFAPRPNQRKGDREFVASEDMLVAGATALFHYHFHAQKERNGEYAGPSIGDLAYARTHGRSCLVLTSVGAGVLNVDYYQPNGAILDLGEIRSGAAGESARAGR